MQEFVIEANFVISRRKNPSKKSNFKSFHSKHFLVDNLFLNVFIGPSKTYFDI